MIAIMIKTSNIACSWHSTENIGKDFFVVKPQHPWTLGRAEVMSLQNFGNLKKKVELNFTLWWTGSKHQQDFKIWKEKSFLISTFAVRCKDLSRPFQKYELS